MNKLFKICIALGFVTIAAACAPKANAEGFYGGVGAGFEKNATATTFLGYDNSAGQLYYGTEAQYSFGKSDNISLSARVGTEFYDNITGYAIAGFGWQTGNTNDNGPRYGLGAKYDIDENFFVGLEVVHQEYQSRSEDSTNLRVGVRF